MTTGLPAANLPGIGFVPPLIGAQQPPGLHRCSQTTLWWSFIADSSVSKSLLLSSLFWFMYSLIYLCMWTRGGEERWQKRRVEERGRQRQLQCLLLYPGERLRYICLLKASATDKHCTATECYKALSVAPKPPTQSQPPSWVNRHCMHVLYAQTKKVVFQLRPGSLKRVKRCCSPLWELQKPKGEEKDTQGVTATSESSTKKSDQTRAGILHTICWAFICLCLFLKPAEASLWKVLGEQVQRNKPTSSGRKAGFKDSTLTKRGSLAEMQTLWRPPSF